MQLRDRVFWITVVLACVAGFAWLPISPESKDGEVVDVRGGNAQLPDFSQFADVKAKKQAFFGFMLPLIQKQNSEIIAKRDKLEKLAERKAELSSKELQWLWQLAVNYRIVAAATEPSQEQITKQLDWLLEKLLRRVDAVPASLALAQAANESAWGTSRFALEGNNLFGQWCFTANCGIVPSARGEGQTHEVASFDSPEASVAAYIHNLNTNLAYREFRQLRAAQRTEQLPPSGSAFAEGLGSYSSRGQAYIEELQAMIRVNQLSQYDSLDSSKG